MAVDVAAGLLQSACAGRHFFSCKKGVANGRGSYHWLNEKNEKESISNISQSANYKFQMINGSEIIYL